MDATRREFRLSAERQCKVRGSGSPSREEAGKRGTCRLQGGTYPRSIYREGRDGDRRQEKRKKVRQTRTLCLRLVWYRDEQGRKYKFITNNWEITDEEVALIYKNRWSIETGFKKLKQNFQLTYFYSDTENGIKTQ